MCTKHILIYIGFIQGKVVKILRKAMPVNATKKHLTKEEKDRRLAVENAFKSGGDVTIEPPDYLDVDQLKAFDFIQSALREADVLSKLDTVTITQAAVAICMLECSNMRVINSPELSYDDKFVATHERLVRTYLKLCDELCLSPQARAKLGVLVANKQKERQDPLLNVLQGDADG